MDQSEKIYAIEDYDQWPSPKIEQIRDGEFHYFQEDISLIDEYI